MKQKQQKKNKDFSLLRTLKYLGKKGKRSKKQGIPCKRKIKEIQKKQGKED